MGSSAGLARPELHGLRLLSPDLFGRGIGLLGCSGVDGLVRKNRKANEMSRDRKLDSTNPTRTGCATKNARTPATAARRVTLLWGREVSNARTVRSASVLVFSQVRETGWCLGSHQMLSAATLRK